MTLRSKYTSNRHTWGINLIENDEGDFEYLTTEGPHFFMGDNEVVSSEGELLSKLMEAVNTQIHGGMPETVTVPVKTDEEKTEMEYAQELEAENPGYEYVDGQMRKKPMIMRIADFVQEQGVNLR